MLMLTAGCGAKFEDWDLLFLRPWPPAERTPAELGLDFETVQIITAGGNRLSAWYVHAVGGDARGTFIIHTGMEGSIERFLPLLPWPAENGFNALVYDWQGFGASEGFPDFQNFEPDARAAVEYVLARPEPGNQRLVHFGISLGSIPALAAAAQYPDQTAGVIVFGGFFPDQIATIWLVTQVSPLLAVFGDIGGATFSALLPDFLDPRTFLDRVQAPILSLIPEDDTIIPPSAQWNLFDALPEPKTVYVTFGNHTHAHEVDANLSVTVVEWARRLDNLVPQTP